MKVLNVVVVALGIGLAFLILVNFATQPNSPTACLGGLVEKLFTDCRVN
jgi:hypothetical protein